MAHTDQILLPAQAQRAQILTELNLIDDAHARLRATDTDLVGTAFRVDVAERLETQNRVNRGLSYRIFGEIADPINDFANPDLPPGVRARDLLWQRLRITRGEIKRRFALAARIRPRRTLTGPTLPAALPELAAAVQAGNLGDDHITTITKTLDHLPAGATTTDREKAEHQLVTNAATHDAPFVVEVPQVLFRSL